MQYSPENAKAVLGFVESCMREPTNVTTKIVKVWLTLMRTRQLVLTNSLRLQVGNKVCKGPFKDMLLTDEAINSYGTPALLGCYEHELHQTFENVIRDGYTRILNIGCSVGYYAVGLARRMPGSLVEAFDIDPVARERCTVLAQRNNVSDRVQISGGFFGEDFAKYDPQETLVLMDIEGAELNLLDPEKYPALKKMDIIVELHDVFAPGLSQEICNRFASSHFIERINNEDACPDIKGLFPDNCQLSSMDHFLFGWEGRQGSTPWGVFTAK